MVRKGSPVQVRKRALLLARLFSYGPTLWLFAGTQCRNSVFRLLEELIGVTPILIVNGRHHMGTSRRTEYWG